MLDITYNVTVEASNQPEYNAVKFMVEAHGDKITVMSDEPSDYTIIVEFAVQTPIDTL